MKLDIGLLFEHFELLILVGFVFVDATDQISLERVDLDIVDDHGHALIIANSHAAHVVRHKVHNFVEFFQVLYEHGVLVARLVDEPLHLLELLLVSVDVAEFDTDSEGCQVHVVDSGLELSGFDFSLLHDGLSDLVYVIGLDLGN